MRTEEDMVERTRSRRRALIAAGVSAAVIAAAGASARWLVPDPAAQPQPHPVVVVDPVKPAPSTEPGSIADASARDVVAHVLAVPFQPVETADDLGTLMGNVAADSYLQELESQWQELVANGWSIEGTPKVVSAEVTESSDTHATVVACVDSSNVRTLDAAGVVIGSASDTSARNVFTLEQRSDGVWRITAHSFPDDPAC